MSDSTVLITGSAGFIGSHLTECLLADGLCVVGLDNFNAFYDPAAKRRNIQTALASPKCKLVEADIRDQAAVNQAFDQHRPATVVHLAAMAGVRPSIEQPQLYADVNVAGTVNVLDAAVVHGTTRFILASSSSVYGNNKNVPFSETDPVDHPISPYAATKKACELIAYTYHHLHRISITCLRFFTVYGPRQRPDLAITKFLGRIGNDQPIPMFGDGSTTRDYTYIDDIVSGIRTAMQPERGGYHIFNLGHDQPVKLRDLIATIEQVTGKHAQIEQLPTQPGDVVCTWADLTHSRRELGYHPATSLADGIAQQWAWMRMQPNKRDCPPSP